MMVTKQTVPDRSRCFGQYRQQSVQYALAHCLECPKVKACVRLTWGMDKPLRRSRRSAWDDAIPARRDERDLVSSRPELLAT
jgi:hypothetical protein